MVQNLINPEDITGFENPHEISTLKKLTNPIELSGDSINTPKQIGEVLKSTNSVQDNFYSGYISPSRQYAIKHCFLKEFNRMSLLNEELDPKNFQLYAGLSTMAAKMALLELQTSNSVEGRFQTNIIEALTGVIKRVWNRLTGKPNAEEGQ